MNKLCKILTVALLSIMIISFVSTTVLAASDISFNDLQNNSKNVGDDNSQTALVSKAGKIMNLIRNIAIIASVIVIMVLGVKYIMGSVEEKAEYKKSFMPLIIGILLVVSATTVASFIFNMAN